ncbi:MAG: hypothetical protein ABL919_02350 [Methylococcales bacterium]|nr:hypothetical protein [Methylococcaceae bacterium]
MNKYGEAAKLAVKYCRDGSEIAPAEAWEKAVSKVFPNSTALQDKSCPKGAFLGLCSEGLVEGIPAGAYGRSTKNKEYAVKAVEVLRSNKFLTSQPDLLWKKVAGRTISSNHQMDVVISLWSAGLVRS